MYSMVHYVICDYILNWVSNVMFTHHLCYLDYVSLCLRQSRSGTSLLVTPSHEALLTATQAVRSRHTRRRKVTHTMIGLSNNVNIISITNL